MAGDLWGLQCAGGGVWGAVGVTLHLDDRQRACGGEAGSLWWSVNSKNLLFSY